MKRLTQALRSLADSEFGEAMASWVIVLVLLGGVVWVMPESAIRRAAFPVIRPIAQTLGLDQNWAMFAPDPPRETSHLDVVVVMADGSQRTWSFHPGDRIVGVFSWYRWQKLTETAMWTDESSRPGLALWVLNKLVKPGELASRVQMIRSTRDLLPPGEVGERKSGTETIFDQSVTDLKVAGS